MQLTHEFFLTFPLMPSGAIDEKSVNFLISLVSQLLYESAREIMKEDWS